MEKKFKKTATKLLSIMLVLALLLPMLQSTVMAANQVSDIRGHWAEATINKWHKLGWFVGNGDGIKFRPDDPITFAEFIKLINKMKGYSAKSADIKNYKDVDPVEWYYDDVAIALSAGFVKGETSTTINPNKKLSRERAITLISRIESLPQTNSNQSNAKNAADFDKISAWSVLKLCVKAFAQFQNAPARCAS